MAKLQQYPHLDNGAGATRFKRGNNANPEGRRGSRMFTLVSAALRERLAEVDPKTKRTFASKIADLMIRCATDPDPEVDKTRIMAITEIIDRCEGKVKQQVDVNDITQELRQRTDEELMYHLEHGCWPGERVLPSESEKEKVQ